MRRLRRIAFTLLCVTGVASAQHQPTFSVNRYRPAERGSRWFSSESLDAEKWQKLAVGATFDWAHRPLTVYDSKGYALGDVVRNQELLHLGISYSADSRIRLGLNIPLVLATSGSSWTVGNRTYQKGTGSGFSDLRVGVQYRIWGEPNQLLRLGVALQAYFPTGKASAYASDESVRLVPRLVGAGDLGIFVWGASVGPDIRTEKVVFSGRSVGSELGFTAAVGVRAAGGRLTFGPEVYGSTRMASNQFFEKRGTPFELLIGGRYAIAENIQIGMATGPGLSTGLGSPASRLLATLEFTSGHKPVAIVPPADSDGDGIIDARDACIAERGEPSDDPSKNGCPPPKDGDGDGVIDAVDACPTHPGVTSPDPKKNGCPPPPDEDKDGVIDELDACPKEAGIRTALPETNGCPPPKDSDKDGIFDEHDACPNQAGQSNDDKTKHGCPVATLVEDRIVILERVEFDTGKATLKPESDRVLEAVLVVMKDNPDVKHVRVEGHTDNRGNVQRNLILSKDRAAAVVKWLVAHGIEASRLSSNGFGQTKPLVSNDTDEGRQNNRRVEFHVEDQPPSNQKAVK